MTQDLAEIAHDIRVCRACVAPGLDRPLPHDPRPILQVSATARIAIFSQAPGIRAHTSGRPFDDPSGVRLRSWMGVTESEFYNADNVVIAPMGFCFPGHDAKRGDLPPRPYCAELWRARLMHALPQIELALLVGGYSQKWHLGPDIGPTLTSTVQSWREIAAASSTPRRLPLPHPSWRNNGWIKKNTWFDRELLPYLRGEIRRLL